MNKALHLRDDKDRLYVSRKEERIGRASIEVSVDKTTQNNIKIEQRKTDYCDQKQH